MVQRLLVQAATPLPVAGAGHVAALVQAMAPPVPEPPVPRPPVPVPPVPRPPVPEPPVPEPPLPVVPPVPEPPVPMAPPVPRPPLPVAPPVPRPPLPLPASIPASSGFSLPSPPQPATAASTTRESKTSSDASRNVLPDIWASN